MQKPTARSRAHAQRMAALAKTGSAGSPAASADAALWHAAADVPRAAVRILRHGPEAEVEEGQGAPRAERPPQVRASPGPMDRPSAPS